MSMETPMTENYHGLIDVSFEGMPSIRLESFESGEQAGMLQRLAAATRRRRFSLREDWQIELNDIQYEQALNGTVEVPAKDADDNSIVFDGASIPFPWLISLMSVGILRPLGVILVGSIVHDYAYRYGLLRIAKAGGNFEEVPLARDQADRLFRDIVGTVNRLSLVGYPAWLAVRLGWGFVKYNGDRFAGGPPIVEYVITAILLSLLVIVAKILNLTVMTSLMLFASIYVVLYVASVVINKSQRLST